MGKKKLSCFSLKTPAKERESLGSEWEMGIYKGRERGDRHVSFVYLLLDILSNQSLFFPFGLSPILILIDSQSLNSSFSKSISVKSTKNCKDSRF